MRMRKGVLCIKVVLWYNLVMNDGSESKRILFEDVDCVHLRVSDLEEGLAFYRDGLGMKLLWRTDVACGLGTEKGSTEIVLSTEDLVMVDMRVGEVEKVLEKFVEAGGEVEEGPFDIDIGKCAVVSDPWNNKYCLLDATKGTYDTSDDGNVMGVSKK